MMKIVSEQELKSLLKDSEVLRRLEAGGVDNWGWYYEALNDPGDIEDWEETNLDNLLSNYSDYNIPENFNFD